VQRAARATGWSPRMLRYLERARLVVPRRSPSGYRRYAPQDVERLRALRDLRARFGLGLAELTFVRRLQEDPVLARAVAAWLGGEQAGGASTSHWLGWEQEKQEGLLSLAA
jgi:MerR family transcriptional regulator, copper efflux regulator